MGKGLVRACKLGNAAGVSRALAAGDKIDKYDGRALQSAVLRNHLQVVDVLLHEGARTDFCIRLPQTAVVVSAGREEDNPLVSATLLHLCARSPHYAEMAALLLRHGADPAKCTSGRFLDTPLHEAARYGCYHVVRALVAGGAKTEVRNGDGHSPLHLAAIPPVSTATICALLEVGADPNFTTSLGNTALHVVCDTSFMGAAFDQDAVRALLHFGASADARNNSGQTPLDRITRLGFQRSAFNQLVVGTPRRPPPGAALVAAPAVAAPAGPADDAGWDFFLSHFQLNGGDPMRLLKEYLEKRGKKCWLDVDSTPNPTGMMAGVAGSSVFLLYLTRGVFTRVWCQRELRSALELRKPIVLLWEQENRGKVFIDPKTGVTASINVTLDELYAEMPRKSVLRNGVEVQEGEFACVLDNCVAVKAQFGASTRYLEAMLDEICDPEKACNVTEVVHGRLRGV